MSIDVPGLGRPATIAPAQPAIRTQVGEQQSRQAAVQSRNDVSRLRQGPLLATNEDRALYLDALGVDVTTARTLPSEVALVELVRQRDRINGPINPALVEKVHATALQQSPDAATTARFDRFANNALRYLADHGHQLTDSQQKLTSTRSVERFG